MKILACLISILIIQISGCSLMYAEKYPQGATANVNYLSEASCSPTIITPKFGETTVFEGDKALEKKWVDKKRSQLNWLINKFHLKNLL